MGRKKVVINALVFLTVLGVIFLPGYSRLQKLREKNEQLQKRIRLLDEHNDKLKVELLKMREDPEYVEKRAREKLGIVKKGEIIYRGSEKTDDTFSGRKVSEQ